MEHKGGEDSTPVETVTEGSTSELSEHTETDNEVLVVTGGNTWDKVEFVGNPGLGDGMGRVLEKSRARGLGCSGDSARFFPLGCSCLTMSFASAARDSRFMDLSAAHKNIDFI